MRKVGPMYVIKNMHTPLMKPFSLHQEVHTQKIFFEGMTTFFNKLKPCLKRKKSFLKDILILIY